MAWEENPRICLHMQLIAILSRTGVRQMLEKVGADSNMDFDKYEEHINWKA